MSGQIQKNDIISEEALKVFADIVKQFQQLIDSAQKLKDSLKDDGFSKTSDNAKKAKTQLTELEKAQKQLLSTQKKLEIETSSFGKKLAEEKVKLTEARRANRELAKEKLGLSKTNKSLKGTFTSLIKSVGVYAAAIFGLNKLVQFFTRDLLNMTKKLDSLDFSMKTVIKDTKELAATNVFLSKTANAYGQDILTLTERYIKFRAAAQQSNMSAVETMRIFDSTAKAASVLGLKTDEVNGVFLALEQMISKGKVTTEELRRQLGERLPGAMGIMADAVGVSISELDKMLKRGEVLSTEALPKFAVALEKAYGIESVEKIDTLAAAHGRLKTSWVDLVNAMSASGAYTKALNSLTNYMTTLKHVFTTKSASKDAEGYFDMLMDGMTQTGKRIRRFTGIVSLPWFEGKADEFQELISEMNKAEKQGVANSKEYFMDRLDTIGFSLKKAELLWEVYSSRIKELTKEEPNNIKIFNFDDYKSQVEQAKDIIKSLSEVSSEELKTYLKTSNSLTKWGTSDYAKILKEQIGIVKKIRTESQKEVDIIEGKVSSQIPFQEYLNKLQSGELEIIKGKTNLTINEQKERDAASKSAINATEALIFLEKELYELQNKKGTKKKNKKDEEQSTKPLEKLLNSQLDSYKAAYAEELSMARNNTEETININREMILNKLQDQDELNALTLTQRQELLARLRELDDKYYQWQSDQQISAILDQANIDKIKISNKYKTEFEASRGTQRDKIAAASKTAIRLLQVDYEVAVAKQALYSKDTEEWKTQEDIKAALQLQLDKESVDATRKMNKAKLEDTVAAIQQGQEIMNESFAFGSALNERAVQNNERRFELETQAAGDNKFKQLVAERKYEKEAAKLKKKQAIADKAQAASNAIINTALGVTNASSKVATLPLVPFIIAQGALQLATILAQPIPKFAEGVEGFGGGLAVVGDKKGDKSLTKSGGSEMLLFPDGRKALSPSSPTLMNLPQGTDVIPHHETTQMLASQAMRQSRDMVDMTSTNSHLKAIKKNTGESVVYDRGYKIVTKPGFKGRYRV